MVYFTIIFFLTLIYLQTDPEANFNLVQKLKELIYQLEKKIKQMEDDLKK